MATIICAQSMEPVQLAEEESYNKVRSRLNQAQQSKIEFENAVMNDAVAEGTKFTPFHTLSFATADGGRISINPEKVVGVFSDKATDKE